MFQYNIKDYITRKVGGNVRPNCDGDEVAINSLFCADTKHHLYVNVLTGLWICFKTGVKGNFAKLYSILEGISYKEAEQRINFDYIKNNLLKPDTKITEIKETYEIDISEEISPFEEISYCDSSKDDIYQEAFRYLYRRKLFSNISPFYLSRAESYKNRIIIPFLNKSKIFYFQARSVFGEKPRYLNCPRRKKSTLVYPYHKDETKHPFVAVCEGPLDALSLQIQEVNATALLGSSPSLQQMIILRQQNQRLVVSMDKDKAGIEALKKMYSYSKLLRIPSIYYCFPPNECKDWNDAHIKDINLKNYFEKNTKEITWDTLLTLEEIIK